MSCTVWNHLLGKHSFYVHSYGLCYDTYDSQTDIIYLGMEKGLRDNTHQCLLQSPTLAFQAVSDIFSQTS